MVMAQEKLLKTHFCNRACVISKKTLTQNRRDHYGPKRKMDEIGAVALRDCTRNTGFGYEFYVAAERTRP